MKSENLKLVTLFLLSAMFISCESDDISENAGRFDSMDVATLSTTAETGTWRISNFVDEDDDDDDSRLETADFNGYSFQFNTDGSILVTKDDLEITGTWRVYLDDDSDDDDSNDDNDSDDDDEMEFDITLSTNIYALQELVDDWDVVEYSNNRIHLVDYDDDNGVRTEDEILIFEKI